MKDITAESSREEVFKSVNQFLNEQGINIHSVDMDRPWGGFFRIADEDVDQFLLTFFSDLPVDKVRSGGKISPKLLVVEQDKRLSWQYHHRRSEIWKVIHGTVSVVTSDSDEQPPAEIKQKGDVITIKKGERHRLIGNKEWGIIAEIWQHADHEKLSDEEDIVRVSDDFGR